MLSQIRKSSTGVEQKLGEGDPPLVGDLAALFPQLYHYRIPFESAEKYYLEFLPAKGEYKNTLPSNKRFK